MAPFFKGSTSSKRASYSNSRLARQFRCIEPAVICTILPWVRCKAHYTFLHTTFSNWSSFVTNNQQQQGAATMEQALLFEHCRSIWTTNQQCNQLWFPSRRRASVGFPLEYALLVNKTAHLSITGINQYHIKSASTMMGTRRQASNDCNRLYILFYGNSTCSSHRSCSLQASL
jgi:hypothetical protein